MVSQNPSRSERCAPLFPLPNFILYPETVQPLRIFESRYLKMVEDLLDSTGLLVMGTVLGNNKRELASNHTVVEPIGTLAQILGYERLENDQYLISVLGLVRVRMCEAESYKPYRLVTLDIVDGGEKTNDEEHLRPTLQEALESRWSSESELPTEPHVSQLADLLLLHLGLPARETYQLYSIQPTIQRARAILDRHESLG